MAVDERGRLQLADAAKRVFGDEAGITLMELLTPVGWADVATKQDLTHLETVMDMRFPSSTPHFRDSRNRSRLWITPAVRARILGDWAQKCAKHRDHLDGAGPRLSQ